MDGEKTPGSRKRSRPPADELAPLLKHPDWPKVSALVWKAVFKVKKKDVERLIQSFKNKKKEKQP